MQWCCKSYLTLIFKQVPLDPARRTPGRGCVVETISPWAPPELRVGEYDLFGDHDIQIDETIEGDDEPGKETVRCPNS
jgi:hypothetical protein